MRYKILVAGNSNIVFDYLQHTDSYFLNMSTSFFLKDIMRHFKLFEPDAFLMFIDDANEDKKNIIKSIRNHYSYNKAPIIIVTTNEIYDVIHEKDPYLADLFVKRPISPDNLSLRVINFLDGYKSEALPPDNIEEAENSEHEIKNAESKNVSVPDEKKHILVVDDDRTILKMLKTALEENYEVTTIVNGVLTEKVIETKKIDLVILDYEMPIMTGAEVFRKLKDHPVGKNIPVCFLTGVAERTKIEEIMKLRPHGYLLKPINMDMFMSTVSNLTS